VLFYHVSEDRLEPKRQRVTDFFLPPLCFCDSILRSSLIDTGSLSIVGGSQKALKLERNGSRFPNFLTKTIKRCKQRVDGTREMTQRETAMYHDDISQRAARYLSGDGC